MHQKIVSQPSPLISMTDYCWLSCLSLEVAQKPGPQVLKYPCCMNGISPSLTFIFVFSEQLANKENKQEDPVWKPLTLKDWQKLPHYSPCNDIFHDWLNEQHTVFLGDPFDPRSIIYLCYGSFNYLSSRPISFDVTNSGCLCSGIWQSN